MGKTISQCEMISNFIKIFISYTGSNWNHQVFCLPFISVYHIYIGTGKETFARAFGPKTSVLLRNRGR